MRLVKAWQACRRTKRYTHSALAFELQHGQLLIQLRDQLLDGTYRRGQSTCFVTKECSKPREVWAAPYMDRIVEWAIYHEISPKILRHFIHDSFACIPGRGTLRAAERLEHHARSATHNWNRRVFYLKCDIANFFVSIHKPTALKLYARWVTDPWWFALLERCLMHDPRLDYRFCGRSEDLDLVPARKRLINHGSDFGLPIGNLLSQFTANMMLDNLDQHVKHVLKAKHYCRYVDDFVLIHESPQQLNAWLREIDSFLRHELRLELNPRKTVLQPCSRGIDFVGQVIGRHGRTVRRRTQKRALHRLRYLAPEHFWQTANSYFGLARQATHSHCFRRQIGKIALARGHSINGTLTKTYRRRYG